MKLLVVGAGSTGGYFGGRLSQAGRDVTFLVRPGRAAHLRQNGLQILSPHGDVALHPQLVTAPELHEIFDAVLVAVKGFSLQQAMADFGPAVGNRTVILPLLNGMRHMELLTDRFGSGAVAGCACKCATVLDDRGRIVQLNKMHDLAFGELNGQPSARMDLLKPFMADAGFDARLSSSIEREMWEKWLLLAAMGAITCLMRGSVGQVVAAPGGRALALAVVDEVAAVISACGIPPSSEALEQARAVLTREGSDQASSMYRDLVQGLPVEADEIVGDLTRRAQGAGIATPYLVAAYTHLCVYTGARRGGEEAS